MSPTNTQGTDTVESSGAAREAFNTLVAEMAEHSVAREELIRRGERLERCGHVVLWYKGLPLPELSALSNATSFTEWLDHWNAAEQPEVASELVTYLETLSIEATGLQGLLALENRVFDRSFIERDLSALTNYTAGLANHFSRIVENVEHVTPLLV
jgi:hypothetical protein